MLFLDRIKDFCYLRLNFLCFLDVVRFLIDYAAYEAFLNPMAREDPCAHLLIKDTSITIDVKLLDGGCNVVLWQEDARFLQYKRQFGEGNFTVPLRVIFLKV